MLRLSQIAP